MTQTFAAYKTPQQTRSELPILVTKLEHKLLFGILVSFS